MTVGNLRTRIRAAFANVRAAGHTDPVTGEQNAADELGTAIFDNAGVSAPDPHAATHKSGGSDALLSAPGPIGGTIPDAIAGTTGHFGNRVTIENTTPELRFIDTNQPLDEGDWEFVLLPAGTFNLRALTEAGGAGDIAFSVARTGTVIDAVDFGSNKILTTGIGGFGKVGIDINAPDKSLEIRNANPIIRLRDTGTPAGGTNAFLEFGGTVAGVWSRTGWVGDGSSGDSNICLWAEVGDLKLGDSSGDSVLVLSGGNATFSGNVNGRDIGVDGTKLDGIETAADVTDATNVAAAGAAMNTDASIVRAWADVDPTALDAGNDLDGVYASFNISGVVDNGNGDHTFFLDTDFASANYALAVMPGGVSGSTRPPLGLEGAPSRAAGSFRISTGFPNDPPINYTKSNLDRLGVIAIGAQ